jgi:hypothetical protein
MTNSGTASEFGILDWAWAATITVCYFMFSETGHHH